MIWVSSFETRSQFGKLNIKIAKTKTHNFIYLTGSYLRPESLMYVNVPAITNAECKSAYGDAITDAMICGGFLEGGKDSCQGDSGVKILIER